MDTPSFMNDRLKKYTCYTEEKIMEALGVAEGGLTDEKALEFRKKYGANRISTGKNGLINGVFLLGKAFFNPFTMILFAIAVFSAIMELWITIPGENNGWAAVIIGFMILISGGIRLVQEFRSHRETKRLEQLFHSSVAVWRNGTICERFIEELVVGDRVYIEAGKRIPADMRIVKADHLYVSQAAVTGESESIKKTGQVLSCTEKQGDVSCENLVFMGTTVVSGSGEGIVLAVGKDTVYGNFPGKEIKGIGSFEHGANSIVKVFIWFILVLVPCVFFVSGFAQKNWMGALLFALSVAVGLIPEMLPMVVTVCLAKGSISMSKKQTIIRNMNAIQGFGSMDILCADKTGTLTGEEMILEYYMDVIGNESQLVLDWSFLNACCLSGMERPIDHAILKYQYMPGKEEHFKCLKESSEKLDEIPFDYVRRCTSVILRRSDWGTQLIVKGDVEEVVSRCSFVEYQGEVIPMKEGSIKDSVSAIVGEMLEDGMKVVAVARKDVNGFGMMASELENNLILMGYLAFFDAPKDTAASAISRLKELKVKTKILTGDHRQVAISICRRVGINETQILTGREINEIDGNRLKQLVEEKEVFAELSPNQKVKILRALKENGHTVGFLGDGMNDVPALCEADVGISVDTAVDAAKDAADVVLLKKDLNVLELGILEGRKTFANMMKYIRITASSNFGNIFSIVCASAFFPFLQMTSIQILLLNLLYDMICIVLPWDYVDQQDYSKPKVWSGKNLGRFMCVYGPISSVFDIITFFVLYFIICPMLCGGIMFEQINDPALRIHFIALFQTGWFLESMWTQVLVIHMLRTDQIPFVQSKPSKSVFVITLAGICLFTAVTFLPVAEEFGLTAMPIWYFGYLIVIAMAYMLLTTFVKQLYSNKGCYD